MVQKIFLDFFRRRLSQRPTAEELEQRNILKRKLTEPRVTKHSGQPSCWLCHGLPGLSLGPTEVLKTSPAGGLMETKDVSSEKLGVSYASDLWVMG